MQARKATRELCWGLSRFVDDPLPFFEVEVPPRRSRVSNKEALSLKQSTESENGHFCALQIVRDGII